MVVVLALIQIGGLGYKTLTTYFFISLRKRLGLRDRLMLAESFNYPGMHGLVKEGQRVVLKLDAYPDRTFEGRVAKIIREAAFYLNILTKPLSNFHWHLYLPYAIIYKHIAIPVCDCRN